MVIPTIFMINHDDIANNVREVTKNILMSITIKGVVSIFFQLTMKRIFSCDDYYVLDSPPEV